MAPETKPRATRGKGKGAKGGGGKGDCQPGQTASGKPGATPKPGGQKR